jgi:hypothetical protein
MLRPQSYTLMPQLYHTARSCSEEERTICERLGPRIMAYYRNPIYGPIPEPCCFSRHASQAVVSTKAPAHLSHDQTRQAHAPRPNSLSIEPDNWLTNHHGPLPLLRLIDVTSILDHLFERTVLEVDWWFACFPVWENVDFGGEL